jgi:mannosyltransferase
VTVEAPARGAAIGTPGATRRWSWTTLFVVGVLAIGFVLRFWTRSDLWLDEALSVNIARLPLSDLHAALRHDGAPPLYYFLLHFWIEAFGIGDLATRSLSGVISLATLPLAWFAGRRLAGRQVAWFAVLVLAASPYAAVYATSTRMYALVMLLVFAGYLAVVRALERPTPARLAVVALVTALLVYTQYWCFYLVGVAGLLLLVRAVRAGSGDTRRAAVWNLAAVAVGAATFIPWVPTFWYQARHTGTPWGNARVPWSSIAEAVLHFAGSDQNGETFILLFALLTLAVLAVFGRAVNSRIIEFDVRTQPRVRLEALLAFGTLVVGTTVSFVAGSAFDARYASVMYPFYVLLVAVGISLFLDPRVRAAVLTVVVVIGLVGGVRNVTTNRTQAAQSTNIIAAEARPGDVVAYCPDQIGPSASRLLRAVPGLVQLTFPNGAAPDRVNWVDYVDRIQAASPAVFADRLVARAGSHPIWFVNALGYNHVEGKCEAISAALNRARPNSSQRVVQDDSIDEYMGLTVYRP